MRGRPLSSFVLLMTVLAALMLVVPGSTSAEALQSGPTADGGGEVESNLRLPEGLTEETKELFKKAQTAYLEAVTDGSVGKYKTAIRELKKVCRKDNDFHLPYYMLGIACQAIRDLRSAEKHLEKALSLRKEFYEAHVELGDTYIWKRDMKRAIEEFDKALAINPRYARGYQSRLVAHARTQEIDKALDDARKWSDLTDSDLAKEYVHFLEEEVRGHGMEDPFIKKTKHYVVYTNHSRRAAAEIASHAELIYRVYTARFGGLRQGKVKFPIIVFQSEQEYVAYGGDGESAGFYNPLVRKLVFYFADDKEDLYTVLYHEAFHQFAHFQLEDTPDWFGEGHGDFFGACRKVPREKLMSIRPNSWRKDHAQYLIDKGRYVELPRLIKMDHKRFYDSNRVSDNYAQAWSLVYFLWMYPRAGDGKYMKVLKKYYSALRKGKGLDEAYESTFGKVDMDRLEKEWKKFIMELP